MKKLTCSGTASGGGRLAGSLPVMLWLALVTMPVLAAQDAPAPVPVSDPASDPVLDSSVGMAADSSSEWDEGFEDEEFADFEGEFGEEGEIIPDPLETWNRLMFAFNHKVYFYVLKPVARGWRHLPRPVRRSVARFYDNLMAPVRIVNNGLQLKFTATGVEALRFGINSTIGVLGLFDPAREFWNLRPQVEDLGQTLGHYGIGQGFYLVLPLWGPSSLRDGLGLLGDTLFLDPIYRYVQDFPVRLAIRGVESVNEVSLDRDSYETIVRDTLDPYSFIKNAYAQSRAAEVAR